MAIRAIESSDLLSLADKLAGREAGPGKPRTIELRRAISTAYYALFHKLIQHAAMRLIGGTDWTEVHAATARWIAHTDLAALSDAVNGRGNQALRFVLTGADPRLADVAQDFIDLQTARHGADYDDYFEVSKASALALVDTAHASVTTATELFLANESSYDRFLGLAIGGVKIAKNR